MPSIVRMPRVIWRGLVVTVMALLLSSAAALAAAPAGPRLAVVKLHSGKPPRLELLNVNSAGGNLMRMAGGGIKVRPFLNPLSGLSWTPGGEAVAFSAFARVREGDEGDPIWRLFAAGDGGGLRPIAGTEGAALPVFSPDGRTLAFTRGVDEISPIRVGGKL
jgi:hypothetical protein